MPSSRGRQVAARGIIDQRIVADTNIVVPGRIAHQGQGADSDIARSADVAVQGR